MTIYRQISIRLFFAFGLPFVLVESIIKNPGEAVAAVRQYWSLLAFIALLVQADKTDRQG